MHNHTSTLDKSADESADVHVSFDADAVAQRLLRMVTSIDQIAYGLDRIGTVRLTEDQLETVTAAARSVSLRMFNFTEALSDEWKNRFPPVNGPEVMRRNDMKCRCGRQLTILILAGYGLHDQDAPPVGDNICLLCKVCLAYDDDKPFRCIQCHEAVSAGNTGHTNLCGVECINAWFEAHPE